MPLNSEDNPCFCQVLWDSSASMNSETNNLLWSSPFTFQMTFNMPLSNSVLFSISNKHNQEKSIQSLVKQTKQWTGIQIQCLMKFLPFSLLVRFIIQMKKKHTYLMTSLSNSCSIYQLDPFFPKCNIQKFTCGGQIISFNSSSSSNEKYAIFLCTKNLLVSILCQEHQHNYSKAICIKDSKYSSDLVQDQHMLPYTVLRELISYI